MKYNELGRTGLKVSEIGFGGEWLGEHSPEECKALMEYLRSEGVNILDCWMSDPYIRDVLGRALADCRKDWIIQGHIGATWQRGQYVRTRDPEKVVMAFEDLLRRLGTDYIDLGMIHYVDSIEDWNHLNRNGFMDYVLELKARGVIRHIGMSTHSVRMARTAADSGIVESLMFSVNPAFDYMPSTSQLSDLYNARNADGSLGSIDPDRSALYAYLKRKGIGLTVMKPFAAGMLLNSYRSPFGVAMTTVQCAHYALTVSGAASIMAGLETVEQAGELLHYEEATREEKDYEKILAGAPRHSAEHRCMYCGHCQPCPEEIDIASVNRLYDQALRYPERIDEIKKEYLGLERNAGHCIACGGCEKRCPFGVGIIEKMRKSQEIFS